MVVVDDLLPLKFVRLLHRLVPSEECLTQGHNGYTYCLDVKLCTCAYAIMLNILRCLLLNHFQAIGMA